MLLELCETWKVANNKHFLTNINKLNGIGIYTVQIEKDKAAKVNLALCLISVIYIQRCWECIL